METRKLPPRKLTERIHRVSPVDEEHPPSNPPPRSNAKPDKKVLFLLSEE